MTKTCSQCGAVLPSSIRVCNFCDSSFLVESSSLDESPDTRAQRNPAAKAEPALRKTDSVRNLSPGIPEIQQDAAWRNELARRFEVYRTRRRKLVPNAAQSQFSFHEPTDQAAAHNSVAVAEPTASAEDDFSFSIAIGRPSKRLALNESRMVIDVSAPQEAETQFQTVPAKQEGNSQLGLHPVASMDDRRLAGLIDLFCLLFAYGGFLMLFSSLGGQFSLNKLSAVVYAATIAIVYLQYFALFTIFGSTTPGMMMRGLQVVSFSGEPPTARQMLLRAVGYMLSAGTFFLGFFWVMWDEDELTWHDRFSRTYLSTAQTFADMESSTPVHSR